MENEIQRWKLLNEKLKDKSEPRIVKEPEPYTDNKATQGADKETKSAITTVAPIKHLIAESALPHKDASLEPRENENHGIRRPENRFARRPANGRKNIEPHHMRNELPGHGNLKGYNTSFSVDATTHECADTLVLATLSTEDYMTPEGSLQKKGKLQ